MFTAEFGGATLAMLWPSLSGGFGSVIQLPDPIDVIKSQIASSRQPYYYGAGRFYIVNYEGLGGTGENTLYAGLIEQGLMALYQKCAHLGCRVPFCQQSQWFECPLAALSTGKAILLGVAAGIGLVVVIGAIATGIRRPRAPRGPDIPPAMRAGPSDPDLEVPVRERLYAWGLVAVVIMAVWTAAVFLRENVTNKDDTKALLVASIERGKLTTEPGGEENQIGFNCERCHGPGLHGGQNVFNGSVVVVPNLQTVCGGPNTGHPLIHNVVDVKNTIMMGRPPTDMPSWSIRFSGGLDDQQIQDLVDYLVSINEKHVPFKDDVCINIKAKGYIAPVVAAQ